MSLDVGPVCVEARLGSSSERFALDQDTHVNKAGDSWRAMARGRRSEWSCMERLGTAMMVANAALWT